VACLNSNSVFALVGFPRTKEQAEEIFAKEPIDAALNLIVPFEIIIERVKGRWIHERSGRIYNMEYSPPKVMVRHLALEERLFYEMKLKFKLFFRIITFAKSK
jgi:adenylate kinase family enzyme